MDKNYKKTGCCSFGSFYIGCQNQSENVSHLVKICNIFLAVKPVIKSEIQDSKVEIVN